MTQLTNNNEVNIEIVRQAVKNTFIVEPLLQQLTFVQAILEGGLQIGRSPSALAIFYNNLFGMKSGKIFPRGTKGSGIIELKTTECDKYHCWSEPQPFLMNEEIEDSIYQHEMLFKRLSRYKPLFDCKTFEEIARQVKNCGYATDPEYPNKLIELHNMYHF